MAVLTPLSPTTRSPMAKKDTPIVDGIRYPVGQRSRDPFDTHYISSFFCDEVYHEKRGVWHPGEDWNGKRGGDTDLGDDVYSIADGRIVAKGTYEIWGNILMLVHLMPNGKTVWSQYAHLEAMTDLPIGALAHQGIPIGTIGKGEADRYIAHLHFEIRRIKLPPDSWQVRDKGTVQANYINPNEFISSWRRKFADT